MYFCTKSTHILLYYSIIYILVANKLITTQFRARSVDFRVVMCACGFSVRSFRSYSNNNV